MTSVPDVDRSRAGWWAVGAVLGAALVFVLYSFVGTFVFGVFIYYATRPIYRRVRRRIDQPSLAAAGSLLVLMLPVVLLLWYAIAIGLQELTAVAEQINIQQYEDMFQPFLDVSQIVSDPAELLSDSAGLDAIRRSLDSATRFVGVLGTGALHLFVMFALAFYMLRDDQRLSRWFHARFDDDAGVVAAYLHGVDRDFTNIFFGNILNAILTGTIGAVTYSVLNLLAPGAVDIPYAALVGLLAGAASLVPVVGMKLVYFPVTAYLLGRTALAGPTEALWFPAAFFVVSFVVVDTIPDLVLRPYVSGGKLHIGMVMFAYIFGPLLFGWYGIFLGPMLLVSLVHFVRIVLPELLAGDPIRPYSLDPALLSHAGERPADARATDAESAATALPASATPVDGGVPADGSGAAPRDGSPASKAGVTTPDGASGDDGAPAGAVPTGDGSPADDAPPADDASAGDDALADDDASAADDAPAEGDASATDEPEAPAPGDGDATGGGD